MRTYTSRSVESPVQLLLALELRNAARDLNRVEECW